MITSITSPVRSGPRTLSSPSPRVERTAFAETLAASTSADTDEPPGASRVKGPDFSSMTPAAMAEYAQSLYDKGLIDLTQLGVLSAENYFCSLRGQTSASMQEPMDWTKYVQNNIDYIQSRPSDPTYAYSLNMYSLLRDLFKIQST